MTEKQEQYGPDMTAHDRGEGMSEEKAYEPSRNAVECIGYLLDEMQQWPGFARFWDSTKLDTHYHFIRALHQAWDRWDNEK